MAEPAYKEFERIPLDDNLNYFYSYDLGCCAALVSYGHELISLDKQNSGRTMFIFIRSRGIGGAVEDYWSDKLQVSARSYFDNLKMLKNRLYSL